MGLTARCNLRLRTNPLLQLTTGNFGERPSQDKSLAAVYYSELGEGPCCKLLFRTNQRWALLQVITRNSTESFAASHFLGPTTRPYCSLLMGTQKKGLAASFYQERGLNAGYYQEIVVTEFNGGCVEQITTGDCMNVLLQLTTWDLQERLWFRYICAKTNIT